MSELHTFMFDGLPVRGAIVRLTGAWQEILKRRAANTASGPYPLPLQELLGEMAAAGVLMQSGLKLDGALILQIQGDGPVKLAVVEVSSDGQGGATGPMSLRATATLQAEVAGDADLSAMVNVHNKGLCAITLDPKNRKPGQQPYQGVVPLFGDQREPLGRISDVLAHYMLQSEQLPTVLVLAANTEVAAGLLIQRTPDQGGKALKPRQEPDEDAYNRISILASSLQRDELLGLGTDKILHRLFWQEPLVRLPEATTPIRFACTCNRARVGRMLRSLGREEVESILTERDNVEVGCEFCGQQYRFDAVDAAQIFAATSAVDLTAAQGRGANLH